MSGIRVLLAVSAAVLQPSPPHTGCRLSWVWREIDSPTCTFSVPGCSMSLRGTVCVCASVTVPVSHLVPTPQLPSRSPAHVDRLVLFTPSMPGDASGQGDLSHFRDTGRSVMCQSRSAARAVTLQILEKWGLSTTRPGPTADTAESQRAGSKQGVLREYRPICWPASSPGNLS